LLPRLAPLILGLGLQPSLSVILQYCIMKGRGGINHYRWAHLLKQQSSISVYCLLTNENKRLFLFPFAANKKKFAVSIFSMHKMIGSCCFPLVLFFCCGVPETWRHGHEDMETWTGDIDWRHRHRNMDLETWRQKTEA
jgi:hypothetical protein